MAGCATWSERQLCFARHLCAGASVLGLAAPRSLSTATPGATLSRSASSTAAWSSAIPFSIASCTRSVFGATARRSSYSVRTPLATTHRNYCRQRLVRVRRRAHPEEIVATSRQFGEPAGRGCARRRCWLVPRPGPEPVRLGLDPKHAIKEVDRLLSNDGIDPWALAKSWVPPVPVGGDRPGSFPAGKAPFRPQSPQLTCVRG